jgi:hypothetical protein
MFKHMPHPRAFMHAFDKATFLAVTAAVILQAGQGGH